MTYSLYLLLCLTVYVFFVSIFSLFAFTGDVVIMWFANVKQLLGMGDDKTLTNVLSLTSCLTVIANSKNYDDISKLVDFVSNIKVKDKYLIIETTALNTTLLQNKKININVMINEIVSGRKLI